MKKISKFALLLAMVLLIAFTGCSKRKENNAGTPESMTFVEQGDPPPVDIPDPKQEDLNVMLRIFDSIYLAYTQNGISGEHSAKNADTVDLVLMYVINNYGEIFDGVTNDNGTVRISVEEMNTLATVCFGDAKGFLETPASTDNFSFEDNQYVLKNNSDRGLQPYPVVRKTEKTNDGKLKTTVEFLTEDENYYYNTVVFYLVPNANDKTNKYPWSVSSFETVMTAGELYKELPIKEMSDAVKTGSGNNPYYQPIVHSYEDAGNGTVYITAKLYKYDAAKTVNVLGEHVEHEYYSGDDNDGLYKFTLSKDGEKYVVKNSEKI